MAVDSGVDVVIDVAIAKLVRVARDAVARWLSVPESTVVALI
jgi:hypothetical protein